MNKGIYIIGDVHGCYKTLMALLNKLPKDAELCFVGDLIDRGSNSADVLEFVINNNIKCVLGNHESFMIEEFFDACHRREKKSIFKNLWQKNGGDAAIDSYLGREYLIEKHLKFIRTLPVYIEFDIYDSKNRKLVVSHSNLLSLLKSEPDFNYQLIWNRILPNEKNILNKGLFNVFGHTPIQFIEAELRAYGRFDILKKMNSKVLLDKELGYANIDTGCVYNNYLSAFHFPSYEVIIQENIEDS